jgi:hypothetical protein
VIEDADQANNLFMNDTDEENNFESKAAMFIKKPTSGKVSPSFWRVNFRSNPPSKNK